MSTLRKIIPLGDRVLVRARETMTKTKSGIFIPDTVEKERPEEGVVIAVGEGRMTDKGNIIAPKVKIGDIVLFSKYSLEEVRLDGEGYYIVSESNILAVIK